MRRSSHTAVNIKLLRDIMAAGIGEFLLPPVDGAERGTAVEGGMKCSFNVGSRDWMLLNI